MAVTEADVDRSMEELSQSIARVVGERDELRAEIEKLKKS